MPPATDASVETPCVEWSSHPAAERPLAALVACVVIILLGLAVHAATGSSVWAVFSVALLCLSLHAFFFATRYRIDAEGLVIRPLFGGGRFAWSDISRAVVHEDVAALRPTRRRGGREIVIRWPRGRPDVAALLRRYLSAVIDEAARGG
ncbi:MAG: hypothetical protein CHACPFDD_02539 [Phycisphaerae bacterium]|nr:hypothetical protein [Phycisphaerae bacterium]